MPMYDYAILDAKGAPTGEYTEEFQRISDDPLTRLEDGRPCARVIRQAPAIQRQWHGQEQSSMALRFAPGSEAELAAEGVTDIKLNKDGFAVFENDAHQKRVYRQIETAKKRHEEEAVASGAKATRAAGDVDDSDLPSAAQVIADRWGT